MAKVDGLGVAGEFLLGHPPVLGEEGFATGLEDFLRADRLELAHRAVGVPNGEGQPGHLIVRALGVGWPALDEEQVVAHEVGHPAGLTVEAELGHTRRPLDEYVAVALADFFVVRQEVDGGAVLVNDVLAWHAAELGDRHNADALAVHERPAPVTDLPRFVGDVDDSLLNAQMRALGGEPEVADDLEAGRLILAAGEACRSCAGDLALVRAAPEQIVPGQDAFRADVEPPGAGAALALAVGLAEVERVHAVDLVGEHASAGGREDDARGFVFQLDAVFVAERLERAGALGGLSGVASQAKREANGKNRLDRVNRFHGGER